MLAKGGGGGGWGFARGRNEEALEKRRCITFLSP